MIQLVGGRGDVRKELSRYPPCKYSYPAQSKEHGFGMTDKYLKGTPYAPHMSQAEGLPTAPIFVSVWERVILNTFAYCGWIPYVF